MKNQPYYMYVCPYSYFGYMPTCNCQSGWNTYNRNPSIGMHNPRQSHQVSPYLNNPTLFDHGKDPFVVNINQAAKQNNNFRTTLWTGDHFQVTLMSIDIGDDVGLEMHDNLDQFLRIEEGQGLVQMGNQKDNLHFVRNVGDDDAIIVPASTWHNVTNTGNSPLKLYSIYAPPNHPLNTVHRTKADDSEH